MKHLYTILLTLFISTIGFTQTINYQAGATAPVPEKVYWYEFAEPNGASVTNCNYSWFTTGQSVFTTSDGSAVGPNYTKRVYIKWPNSILNDHPDGRIVTVTVNGCETTTLNVSKDLTVNTKYLPPPTFKTAGGSTITTLNVQCYAPEITLRLASIPDAVYYHWELPAGWSKKGSPGVNLFSTNTPTVDVTVGQGVTSTSIKAYTSIDSFNGPSTTLPVTRNADQISFIGPNPTVYCASKEPISYQVTAVAGLSYSWTYPASWTCQSGCNSSIITLVPDDSNVQGQSITARGAVACGGGTAQTNIASQVINFSTAVPPDFVITGPSLVCTGQNTFTLNNVSAGTTVTWQIQNNGGKGGITPSSGTGTSATITIGGLVLSGPRTIVFTINSGCGNVQVQKTFYTGDPVMGITQLSPNPLQICPIDKYYSVPYVPGVSYQWSINGPVNGGPYMILFNYNDGSSPGGGVNAAYVLTTNNDPFDISVTMAVDGCSSSATLTNQMGNGIYCTCHDDPGICQEQNGRLGLFSVHPNPAANYLDVTVDESEFISTRFQSFEIILLDNTGTKQMRILTSDKSKRINTSSLKDGNYFIQILYKGKKTQGRIIIDR